MRNFLAPAARGGWHVSFFYNPTAVKKRRRRWWRERHSPNRRLLPRPERRATFGVGALSLILSFLVRREVITRDKPGFHRRRRNSTVSCLYTSGWMAVVTDWETKHSERDFADGAPRCAVGAWPRQSGKCSTPSARCPPRGAETQLWGRSYLGASSCNWAGQEEVGRAAASPTPLPDTSLLRFHLSLFRADFSRRANSAVTDRVLVSYWSEFVLGFPKHWGCFWAF